MKKSFISFALCSIFVVSLLVSFVSCAGDRQPSENNSSQTTNVSSDTLHRHIWGEWTTVVEATCQSEGKAERVCSCGEKDTRITYASHTSMDWIIDKEATLREEGKRHKVCSVCNQVFNEKVIPRVKAPKLEGITDSQQEQYRPRYQLSNCRNLKGKPVVVAIFLDDNESSWTESEVTKFTDEQIVPALDYLEEKAKGWDVSLDFVLETYSTATSGYEIKYEGIVNSNLENGGSTKDALIVAANDIGCANDWELYCYYKSIYPQDDIIFLCFLDKPGRSYARPAISTGYSEFAEECVIFSDYLGNTNPNRRKASRSTTIAHEILHLFGAEDYYEPRNRELLALRNFPNDIMLYQYENPRFNTISEVTAYSIGWTDVCPDILHDARWQE